jgi:hypothetical protein
VSVLKLEGTFMEILTGFPDHERQE